MTEPIHILATCRKPELMPAATLVFRTLRVGFPQSQVNVYWNGPQRCEREMRAAVESVRGIWRGDGWTETHASWIQRVIREEGSPFWICDTDVVFWREFQHAPDGSALAGVRTPSFFEPWMGTQYRERLHTCLMRIHPERFATESRAYRTQFPAEPFSPNIDFVSQQWQPERRNGTVTTHFYDTLAMAWHAFGGQEFTPEQIESFDHLNCATYADLIAPSVDFDMLGAHKAVYENLENARGLWKKQFEWFSAHKEKPAERKPA